YSGYAKRVLRQLQNMYQADMEQADDRFKGAPERANIDVWVDLAASAQALASRIPLRNQVKCTRILDEFGRKVKVAPLYYSDNYNHWKVSNIRIPAGNHSKLYIIDEECFYIGSDNMYPSKHKEGLQEFGYLIEDKNETQNLIKEYWDNIWKYSAKHALS